VSTSYKILLFLHIASVVAAFGPMLAAPLTAAQARKDGDERRVVGYFAANNRKVHMPALGLAGLFGIGLIFSSDDVWEFSQTWVSLSFLVWFALCGVVSGMIMPAERAFAAGDQAAERKVALGGQIATVLFLVILYLMIFKPGA